MPLIDSETVKEYLKRVIWGADSKIDKWVEAMPTIDAIPVEWLRHRLMMAQKNGSAHPEQAIQYVLWLWEQQKDGEQEAHGT